MKSGNTNRTEHLPFCFACANEFIPKRRDQRYCSKRCKYNDYNRTKRVKSGKTSKYKQLHSFAG